MDRCCTATVRKCGRRNGGRGGGVVAALASLFLTLSAAADDPDPATFKFAFSPLMSGVEYGRYESQSPPLVCHAVKANLKGTGLRLGVLTLPDASTGMVSLVRLLSMAGVDARYVVAALSGDYCGNGVVGPWGMEVVNRQVHYSPNGRSAFLIASDGTPGIDIPALDLAVRFGTNTVWHPIRHLNRPKHENQPGLSLFTDTLISSAMAVATRAAAISAPAPLADGVVTARVTRVFSAGQKVVIPRDQMILNYRLPGRDADPVAPFAAGQLVAIRALVTPAAAGCVSGGPRLIRDGTIGAEFDREPFGAGEAGYLKQRHPRSAVGIGRDRATVYMVVVEGRTSRSRGMDPTELGRLMAGLGAWNAMMFDGGASAEMVAGANRCGSTRGIYNGLTVLSRMVFIPPPARPVAGKKGTSNR